jgi:hypothetical protein
VDSKCNQKGSTTGCCSGYIFNLSMDRNADRNADLVGQSLVTTGELSCLLPCRLNVFGYTTGPIK